MKSPLVMVAGVLGAFGVALGAVGAHALEATLAERGMAATWETAVNYHLGHAVALLALGLFASGRSTPAGVRAAGWCWAFGVLAFSGSLYWLALGGPRWLGPVTPLGGVAFILGWLLIAFAPLLREGTDDT